MDIDMTFPMCIWFSIKQNVIWTGLEWACCRFYCKFTTDVGASLIRQCNASFFAHLFLNQSTSSLTPCKPTLKHVRQLEINQRQFMFCLVLKCLATTMDEFSLYLLVLLHEYCKFLYFSGEKKVFTAEFLDMLRCTTFCSANALECINCTRGYPGKYLYFL